MLDYFLFFFSMYPMSKSTWGVLEVNKEKKQLMIFSRRSWSGIANNNVYYRDNQSKTYTKKIEERKEKSENDFLDLKKCTVKPEITTTSVGLCLWNINLPLNNDHLSTTATNFGSRGWSLYTGLTVIRF